LKRITHKIGGQTAASREAPGVTKKITSDTPGAKGNNIEAKTVLLTSLTKTTIHLPENFLSH